MFKRSYTEFKMSPKSKKATFDLNRPITDEDESEKSSISDRLTTKQSKVSK